MRERLMVKERLFGKNVTKERGEATLGRGTNRREKVVSSILHVTTKKGRNALYQPIPSWPTTPQTLVSTPRSTLL